MTTLLIGLLEEAKPVERKDKTTGQVTMHTQVTVTFQSEDTQGYLVKSTENIQLDIKELGNLQIAKGKYISIPYNTINTKNGTFTFPDDAMTYTVFEKNPLEIPVKKTA